MTAKRKVDFRPPETVEVRVNRGGAEMSATVQWGVAPAVLMAMLDVMRGVQTQYPELLPELTPLTGGAQSFEDEGGWYDRKRAVGFRP